MSTYKLFIDNCLCTKTSWFTWPNTNYLMRAAHKWICWWFISVESKDLEKLLQGTDRKEVIISHCGNSLCPYPYTLSTFSIFFLFFFPQYSLLYKLVCHILYGLIPILNVWNRRKALTIMWFSVCWTCGSFYKNLDVHQQMNG